MIIAPILAAITTAFTASIIAPQDAHQRLVLQIVDWLTDVLSGLASMS